MRYNDPGDRLKFIHMDKGEEIYDYYPEMPLRATVIIRLNAKSREDAITKINAPEFKVEMVTVIEKILAGGIKPTLLN